MAIIQITHEESFGALFISFENHFEIFSDLRNWKTDSRTRVGNLPMSVTTKCEAFTTITAKVNHILTYPNQKGDSDVGDIISMLVTSF